MAETASDCQVSMKLMYIMQAKRDVGHIYCLLNRGTHAMKRLGLISVVG